MLSLYKLFLNILIFLIRFVKKYLKLKNKLDNQDNGNIFEVVYKNANC